MLLQIDLSQLFKVEASILSLILRGTILYLGLLFLLRILPNKTGGETSMMDLVFVLLITEAAAHSLGDYSSLTEGFIVIATIATLNFLVNVLSYYSPFVEKIVSTPPVQIIKNGKMLRKNMRREFLTEKELISHLREEGIEDIAKVKKACIESDGNISVVTTEK